MLFPDAAVSHFLCIGEPLLYPAFQFLGISGHMIRGKRIKIRVASQIKNQFTGIGNLNARGACCGFSSLLFNTQLCPIMQTVGQLTAEYSSINGIERSVSLNIHQLQFQIQRVSL